MISFLPPCFLRPSNRADSPRIRWENTLPGVRERNGSSSRHLRWRVLGVPVTGERSLPQRLTARGPWRPSSLTPGVQHPQWTKRIRNVSGLPDGSTLALTESTPDDGG